jgi:hypothetical protein
MARDDDRARHRRTGSMVAEKPSLSMLLRENIARRGLQTRREPMAVRLNHRPEQDEPAAEPFSQRKRAEEGRFRLQVDRQTKRSFTTYEAAEEAGLAIKKSHPILQVAVYDGLESSNKIIELPQA